MAAKGSHAPANTDPDPDFAALTGGDTLGDTLELADVLNTALDKGVAVHGEVTIAVADIDLIRLNLGLLLGAIDKVVRGSDETDPEVHGSSPSHRTSPDVSPGARRSLASALGPPQFGPGAPASSPEVPASAIENASQTALGVQPNDSSKDSHTRPSRDRTSVLPQQAPEAPLAAVAQGLPHRIHADAPGAESGLARLVLTLIEVLRKVLEHQAVRRMDGGKLTVDEIERLGLALSRLNDRMDELKSVFGLNDDDLHIDLGPLGRVR